MKSVYDILLSPVMTEKSMGYEKGKIYTFLVQKEATKVDIKKAVEGIFDVKVSKVNVLNRLGKKSVFKGRRGTREDRKFAIVSLSDGTINYEGGI